MVIYSYPFQCLGFFPAHGGKSHEKLHRNPWIWTLDPCGLENQYDLINSDRHERWGRHSAKSMNGWTGKRHGWRWHTLKGWVGDRPSFGPDQPAQVKVRLRNLVSSPMRRPFEWSAMNANFKAILSLRLEGKRASAWSTACMRNTMLIPTVHGRISLPPPGEGSGGAHSYCVASGWWDIYVLYTMELTSWWDFQCEYNLATFSHSFPAFVCGRVLFYPLPISSILYTSLITVIQIKKIFALNFTSALGHWRSFKPSPVTPIFDRPLVPMIVGSYPKAKRRNPTTSCPLACRARPKRSTRRWIRG